jgi:peptide/nickel transport system substrate-binding protein/microcin C transport system substrate-binding protein
MQVPADRSSIAFRLNPKARFSNGDPVTASDVKFSFDTLSSPQASPVYSSGLVGVESVVIEDDRTIRFNLKDRTADAVSSVAGLPVFSHKWGLAEDGTRKPFDQLITEYPLTSGPYTIDKVDTGRRIEFVRNKDYWAKDIGVRRGFYNFDRIIYRYYLDSAITLEAFKAGEFDMTQEYSARRWIRQHSGVKYRDGQIIKRAFPLGMMAGYAGFYLNLRDPLFQDPRVREAINLSYDFEEFDRQTSHQYKRLDSVFSNSDFAAHGLPTPGELALIEPFRDQLDPKVFGPAYREPTTGERSLGLRANLLKARDLLADAGWVIADDGVLHNTKGEPFEFELLDPEGNAASQVASWQRNLEKLGITMRLRSVDFALYRKRVNDFDFQMIQINPPARTMPGPADIDLAYGSKAADRKGSNNYMGIKNPVLDALIDRMKQAKTLPDFIDATRAFDRVFMYGHYGVPYLYIDTLRMSYWNKFGLPDVIPPYYTALLGPDVTSLLAWPVATWWLKGATAKAVN